MLYHVSINEDKNYSRQVFTVSSFWRHNDSLSFTIEKYQTVQIKQNHKTSLVQIDLKKFGQIYNQKAKVKIELLQTTIVSQANFECSKYSRSIYVIDVKSNQNFSCGLTNISDNTFDFCGIRENSNSFV